MLEANATNYEIPAKPKGNMRLKMPEPDVPPCVASDHEGSSQDELGAATGLHAEDVHSVVGVSISRAQTRLVSPQTPAVERAAALAELEGGGLFDGVKDEDSQEAGAINEEGNPPKTPQRQASVNLPSPWRAEPKTFEKQGTSDHISREHGPSGMLAEVNIKRYVASFNLSSMPKAPSMRDFSMPSLSSLLSNSRSHTPMRKSESRQKRASTIDQPRFNRAFFESRPKEDSRYDGPSFSTGRENSKRRSLESSKQRSGKLSTSESNHCDRRTPIVSTQSPQLSPLRRTTSDQSLLLRKVTSAATSLGDDSRWDHVQEQVNSRMKAIKDSLQDSSMKLPSLSTLSTLNLDSFRPEFTRNRAQSETKRSTISDGTTKVEDEGKEGSKESIWAASRQSLQAEAFQAKSKTSGETALHIGNALADLTGDLVILGGYRGSILRSAKPPHRQLWVPVKVGLNIRKVNLEVGLKPEDEEAMHDHIFASGMLSHIGPVDMGRRLLKRLKTCKNAVEGRLRVHDYGYDWRLSPHLLSRRFLAFLQELPCNAPNVPDQDRGATVIAHSMGGLITRHAVNRRPELFAGVVYAGVPQHCVNILGPLRNGDDVLLSSKVLTAQVNFTLRSSFLLLPEDGKCFLDKVTKEEYPVNFFDADQWKQYAWSPCIAPCLPPSNPPETKSMLESVTSMLPSMPSLPLPGRKASTTQPKENSHTSNTTADTISNKITNATNAFPTRALDPQLSPSTTHHQTTYPQTTLPLSDALTYLHRTLAATLAFKAEMVHDPTYSYPHENLYPPLSIIYANNTPTVSAARVSSRDAIKRADAYDDLQFGSGDGVCLARAAMLPEGYVCEKGGKVKTERGHVGLLGDLEAVGRCLEAVREGRRRGVGLGVEGKRGGG